MTTKKDKENSLKEGGEAKNNQDRSLRRFHSFVDAYCSQEEDFDLPQFRARLKPIVVGYTTSLGLLTVDF